MMRLMTDSVLPYLRSAAAGEHHSPPRAAYSRNRRERARQYAGALMLEANPTVGLAAHTAQTDIRYARAATAEEAEALIDAMAARGWRWEKPSIVRNRRADRGGDCCFVGA